MKIIEHNYTIRIKYLGGFCEDFIDKIDWYRDVIVPASITLESLNATIQEILQWDDSHLFKFVLKDTNYCFFGFDDDYVIDDIPGEYLSCEIPINLLNLQENDEFIYKYDFGDLQIFSLKIIEKKIVDDQIMQNNTAIPDERKSLATQGEFRWSFVKFGVQQVARRYVAMRQPVAIT